MIRPAPRFFGLIVAIAFGVAFIPSAFAAGGDEQVITTSILKSKYLRNDKDAISIAEGKNTVRLPEENFGRFSFKAWHISECGTYFLSRSYFCFSSD